MFSRFNYGVESVLGPVYGDKTGSGGNIIFWKQSLIVPVGNRINIVDLPLNSTKTLSCENRSTIQHISLSPDGTVLLSIDIRGNCLLVSMPKGVEVGRFTFKQPVTAVKFSPNNKFVLVAIGRTVEVWRTPLVDRKQFAPFQKYRELKGAFDEVVAMDWSADSKHILLGSLDMTVRVYALNRAQGFKRGTLGGHRDYIVSVAFGTDKVFLIFFC